MVNKKVVLTYEGLKRMENELEELKTIRRKDVAEKIKEARSQGDLSENAEYDAAKEEQAEIETRIVKLEKLLRNAEVIDEEELSREIVNIGNTVKLFDETFGEECEYTIVGSAEADPLMNKLSNESPVGQALIGKTVGNRFEVETPNGNLFYKVLEIR